MQHKSFELIETKTDAEAGTFEATVAVFNNVDQGGDRIVAGAFDRTLAKWRQSGDPIPVILSHQWDNPMAHIGIADPSEAIPTAKGLRIKGRLDVNDNDVARQVHKLLQRRSLREFSFGYSVPAGGQKRAKDGANELLEIDLVEVGPTLKGMNPATELHAVKSALGVEDPPRSDEELRKATAAVEREEEEARLPDVPAAVKAVGPGTRGHIENLVRYYAGKPHPFTECVRDNTKRFGEDRAKRICATLKRMGGRKAEDPNEPDWVQELYDAADGNVEGLLEMFHDHMTANGDKSDAFDNLPQETVDRLVSRAQQILESSKSVDVTDQGPSEVRRADPLKKQADAVALEFASGGQSLLRPPKTPVQPKPEPEHSLSDLRKRMREEILVHLSGGIAQ